MVDDQDMICLDDDKSIVSVSSKDCQEIEESDVDDVEVQFELHPVAACLWPIAAFVMTLTRSELFDMFAMGVPAILLPILAAVSVTVQACQNMCSNACCANVCECVRCSIVHVILKCFKCLEMQGECWIWAMEVCAGVCSVSNGLLASNFPCIPIDFLFNGMHNLCEEAGYCFILGVLLRVRVGAVIWLAPVCASWIWNVRAVTLRSWLHPEGLESIEAVRLANLMCVRCTLNRYL